MELRHLRYFVAVVQEGQFVRAAARLHVAQSALSQQIRDLERELGTGLLVRDRRGVALTPAGEVLLDHAQRLLDQADAARAEIAQLTGLVAGRLRLGTGTPTGPVALGAILAELQRRHPLVQIVLRDTTTAELIQWLEEDTIDVGLISIDARQLPERLEGTLVAHEPVVVLVPADHRLAGRRRLALPQLSAERLVTFPRGSGMRGIIEAGFRTARVPVPQVTAETNDPLTIVELLVHGLGITLAPESFAALVDERVRAVPLARPGLTRSLSVAWARRRRSLPALDAFLAVAAETPLLDPALTA